MRLCVSGHGSMCLPGHVFVCVCVCACVCVCLSLCTCIRSYMMGHIVYLFCASLLHSGSGGFMLTLSASSEGAGENMFNIY